MPSDLPKQIATIMQNFSREVERFARPWESARGPAEFRTTELDIAGRCRGLADQITAAVLHVIIADPGFQAATSLALRETEPGKYRHGGCREVGVTLLGGSQIRVRVGYVKPDLRGRPGRRRGRGKRGCGGSGVYPQLAALGISFGVTPAVVGEICRQVTDSDSVRAGRSALARRGLDLGHKQTLRLVNAFGRRAVEQRGRWLEDMRTRPPPQLGPLRGKRVVVAPDGGRLRERVPAACGRRRTNTRHRGYDAPWREPKLFVIYVIDDAGHVVDSFQPVYDGTLKDADATFDMLLGYLRALGAHEAAELIIVGDGAEWIWNRTAALACGLSIPSERVVEVVDWYHCSSVLHEIAEIPAHWPKCDRDAWVTRAKRHLHAGRIDHVLAMIDMLSVGRRAKKVSKHRGYFDRNRSRMQYAAFEAGHVPTGSGAVESAVRRVINMRMKSNGMFWLEINAEGMILLRSYLKSERFDDLVDWSIATSARWWNADDSPGSQKQVSSAPIHYAHVA